ncbi:ABC transporter substrate-binding protein [Arthrobacter sp. NPDC058130]|uniref:ABC transporter substrate-binding protein n=1 Tax=Arthrobacter sp. NPDC058130 TaxID=3346353 RepID=UPI0036F1593A
MSSPEANRRSVLAAALYGGGALFLASCAQGSTTPQSTPQPGTSGTASGPVQVTDQRGTVLSFDRPVTRVVTIPMPTASLLAAVDQGTSHLAGMHNASWVAMRDGVMGTMYPDALNIPHDIATTDFTPNVESIRALNPDVVVQWSDAHLTAPLEQAGMKVLGITNTGTQEDVDTWTSLFATLLGRPDRAVQIKARSDEKLKSIQAEAAARGTGGPGIIYFNRFSGGLKVAGNGSYNDFYIKLVGGHNPATGPQGLQGKGMVGVDVEQVLAWDPEVILLGNFDEAMPADLYGNPVWQSVSAVRSHRVYKVPLGGYRWDPPGQESQLMWRWLSDISFPSGDRSALRDETTDCFDFLYRYRLSAPEMDKILWTEANGASANYRQFDAS